MQLSAGAALAVLLVVLAGCGSDDRTDLPSASRGATPPAPTTVADTRGSPPRMPWWSSGRLHTSEGVIRTPMRRIVSRGGTVVIGPTTRHGGHWSVLGELKLLALPSSRSSDVHPVLSANGRFAAWTTSTVIERHTRFVTDAAFTVTAYDVGRGRVIGTTVLESRVSCCDAGGAIEVAGVDNDGSVVIGRYADRGWIWRHGSRPVPLTGDVRLRGLSGNDQWPGGVSWTTGDDSGERAAYGRVSADGVVTRVGRVPQSQSGLWSTSGRAYVYSPAVKERQLRPVVWRDGRRRVLPAPRGSWPIAWETDRRVLLVDGDLDASIRLVRCWVGAGRCEQAGPRLRHAQVPDTTAY